MLDLAGEVLVMFSLFDTVGSMLRNLFALGFAAFWGISSMMFDLKRIADMAWASTGGMLLVLGLVGAGLFVGFVALILHLRDRGRHRAAASQSRADEAGDWDPDQIIACHLARRSSMMPRPVAVPRAVRHPLPTRRFGRKIR
ncbi:MULTISPECIES: hypothetical protein [unclassified Novosphingobium]|uniref:hypothetical protein n=2 Tax=Novosphingobium TaxID=165696 RepID=UPI001AC942E3|nr:MULTISPECIES: hypothetical protein [unclassified Novosphingobium]MBN9143534.1 hypothetical protein [Novosphingobium sp.]MDR6706784.1 hypothetical protein [Novosphingobium sp. 1748]